MIKIEKNRVLLKIPPDAIDETIKFYEKLKIIDINISYPPIEEIIEKYYR